EFFIRTPMPTLVFPPEEHSSTAVAHEAYQDFQVPLGVDEDREVLTWFPRKQAHLLITGQSGSGKTVVQHNVAERLTQAGWRTWILDGKRIE
ncbi:FtsK/SpoIIIE domain-containing protein, partial [Streptococcus anginosus]|nr:FtsK/SpoIIIE domain-containing protein [Streptococcus anginosus]